MLGSIGTSAAEHDEIRPQAGNEAVKGWVRLLPRPSGEPAGYAGSDDPARPHGNKAEPPVVAGKADESGVARVS